MAKVTNVVHDADKLEDRIKAYAGWVMQLRSGMAVPTINADSTDPLSGLGRELQLLAETLNRREEELRLLFDLVGTVEKDVLVEDVLDRIYEGFSGLIPYERIGCAFMSENGARVTAYWARSELGPIQIPAGYSHQMAGSSLESILQTGQPRILNDLETYLEAKPQSDATRRIVLEGGRSSLTCPLTVEHRPVGFLFFTSRNKGAYRETHQTIFRQIASQVSAVIDNSRTFLRIIEHNRQLIAEGKKLTEVASHDALTGILNRGAIMEEVKRALKAAAEGHAPVGIVMADIDHFKDVNDSLGHGAGDIALKEFTRRLTLAIRRADQVGRYGGEEFLIVVTGVPTQEILHKVVEHMRQAIVASPFDLGSESRVISASFGAVLSYGANQSTQDVVAAADRALYLAKNGGRNCIVIGEDVNVAAIS